MKRSGLMELLMSFKKKEIQIQKRPKHGILEWIDARKIWFNFMFYQNLAREKVLGCMVTGWKVTDGGGRIMIKMSNDTMSNGRKQNTREVVSITCTVIEHIWNHNSQSKL